jgi:hypothetical protein
MTATAVGSWVPTDADLRAYALHAGVCVRPVLREAVDTWTGDTHVIALRCGTVREAACPPCAVRNRSLRMSQCAEGWHLVDDPLDTPVDAAGSLEDDDPLVEDGAPVEDEAPGERRARSTRRRDDAPELPRPSMESRTIGRTFRGKGGVEYRPSMFVTLTLPSYGRVIPGRGTPVDAGSYDYAQAARDAIALSALVDRWVQNLRRAAGYRVQYFAVIEAQRRLAGHVHLAIRGAIPRALLKQVTKATYASLWWPPTDTVVYDDRPPPVWDPGTRRYVDPVTRVPLPAWRQALDTLDTDPEARAWHVTRFGAQIDIKGITAPSPDADRTVRYLTKYLTKSITHTYAATDDVTGLPVETDPAIAAHADRLTTELRYLPCSPRCANWLRHGITPDQPGPGLIPGHCHGKAHDRANVGLGGRRVLVSRLWSGKTLSEHAADRAAVVREALEAAGIHAPDADRLAADYKPHQRDGDDLDDEDQDDQGDGHDGHGGPDPDDGTPRYRWRPLEPGEADYRAAIVASAREQHRWRQQYQHAKAALERQREHAACGHQFGNDDGPDDEKGMAA